VYEALSQPLKGSTTRPLSLSIVNALKVPAAGVHAQPSPNFEVPITDGCAAFVTST
jgi:hypothetical protein